MAAAARRSARRAMAACLAALVVSACTGHHDEPGTSAGTGDGLRLGGNLPAARTSTATPAEPATTPMARALAAVPPSVLYASFTDLAALRRDLGYAQTDSESPAGERFAFWEDARVAGTMLTGTRLYDDVSVMEADYGWTADDVAWEIDFSGNETGCLEDMICDPSGGSVLSLRPGVSARTVIQSLDRNGFTLEPGGQTWSTESGNEPFTQAVYLPELNAVALGNAIGLRRIVEVAGGAPSLADQIPTLGAALGSPLSAYVDTTGCVSLGEALGPDATDGDRRAFAKANDVADLASASAWAVTIDSDDSASSLLDLGADDPDATVSTVAPSDEVALRSAVLSRWASVQAGVDFGDVAAGVVTVGGQLERVEYDVQAMPTFAAMVLTHDAPWALCATSAAG
ncbi:MAG TPA: hypothetical protein VLK34_09285 [Nocardioidaceae bacterium]|nr:hypothetical protein [Nocardioidaceae bacterium]